jgi:hypothetical protein
MQITLYAAAVCFSRPSTDVTNSIAEVVLCRRTHIYLLYTEHSQQTYVDLGTVT